MKKIFLLLVLFTFVHPIELNAQSGRIKRKKKTKKEIKVATPKKKEKAYADFVTPKTKTDEGLF
ncbi:hypothetical protein N9820_05655, partial [Polaribacter sp.]